MPLASGRRLGPYEIVAPCGAGGMGEVYEARDTRLGRTVAIKVLPEGLARDGERRARFEREARTVSQLTHPHVCTLHDVGEEEGVSFLVMEHCEGETLAARLARGALPLPEVLRHGAQVAEALDAAHRRGVVHRDLKPANVMLTRSGVKLLDFGLARLAAGEAAELGHLPTMTMKDADALTAEGTVLGTFPYMSPEQVEGQEADARSDIFALGAVLYEMATGRRAFAGKSAASVMAAVLKEEPEPLSRVQPVSPPALDHVVSRCLAKDAERRWQSARDVAEELRWIAEAGSQAGVAAPLARRRKSRERLAWGLFAGAVVLALALGAWAWRLQGPEPRLTYLSIQVPADAQSVFGPAISPDGRKVAYAVWGQAGGRLYVRSLDRLEPEPVAGAENVRGVFFSPDGRWLAYIDAEARELRRIAVGGGSPFTICATDGFAGGDWREDGTIVFSKGPPAGLWTVSAAGGEPRPLTRTNPRPGPDRSDGHFDPQFLPGGDAVLFTSWAPGGEPEHRLGIAELASGETRLLFEGADPWYSQSGHLLFLRPRDSALVAVPFDLDQLRVAGDPMVIASDVDGLALSRAGTLVYEALREKPRRLVWMALDGTREPVPVAEAGYQRISIAPDGRRAVAVVEEPSAEPDIWLLELDRGASTPVTTYRGWDHFPVWAPDGESIAFSSDRDGPPTLYRVAVEGGEPERLTREFAYQESTAFSPDGRRLLFNHVSLGTSEEQRETGGNPDVWMLDLESRETVPLLDSRATERNATLSPDGRWLAYLSDESGRPEVYLRSFPDLGSKRRVSLEGAGGRLHWAQDGKSLWYGQGREGGGSNLMAVEIATEPALTLGEPRAVLSLPADIPAGDIAPDGQRLLLIERTGEDEREIVVILGWGQSMRER
ncbi:MAG TPA: protein kinase [Thermoanaerobaculia bacterium]|nr:protein kinase [Thermoanaerobaculia bacterium]